METVTQDSVADAEKDSKKIFTSPPLSTRFISSLTRGVAELAIWAMLCVALAILALGLLVSGLLGGIMLGAYNAAIGFGGGLLTAWRCWSDGSLKLIDAAYRALRRKVDP